MKGCRKYIITTMLTGLLLFTTDLFAQDPNFYLYLCFGQSNMEGQGLIENQDKTVDSRFKVMEAINCSNLGRTKGNWYTAVPPLCRCNTGLSPADYFGRKMVDTLPDSIKIGIINVSVAGCKIELFDKDNYQSYVSGVESWMKGIINEYGGNPYARLVEIAALAKQDGVIKGILMHQGESNTGDNTWPSKVKQVYDNLINDLELDPDSIPLLAGEVVHADQGGLCASMNSIIARLPQVISNSHVISSSGCAAAGDKLHFSSAGYREIGTRYAVKMLSLLGYDDEPEDPVTQDTISIYFEPECAVNGENWEIVSDETASNGRYVTVRSGLEGLTAPTDDENAVTIPFSIDSTGNYSVYARLNCPGYDDDSFWLKIDDGEYLMCNGLVTSGWQWVKLSDYELTVGEHTMFICYREDGTRLDKICVSNSSEVPEGMGDEANNLCDPSELGSVIEIPDGYRLEQNYPNPFNPSTLIKYSIPVSGYVTLKVYDLLGQVIQTLFDGFSQAGSFELVFEPKDLTSGVYIYRLSVGNFTESKKLLYIQ